MQRRALVAAIRKGVLPMRLEDYPTEPRFNATVLSTERITDEGADAEVRELVLEVDRDEFKYEIGQSVGVSADGYRRYAQRCPELMNDTDQTAGQCRVSSRPSANDPTSASSALVCSKSSVAASYNILRSTVRA